MTTKTPPRAFHLLPASILAEHIAPSYATSTNRLPNEVLEEVHSGLREGRLQEPLVTATFAALKAERPTLTDEEILEKMAVAMAKTDTGPRPMSAPERARNRMMPLFAFIDVNVGRASDAARTVLESPEGRKMLQQGVDEAGKFLAERLLSAAATRKRK